MRCCSSLVISLAVGCAIGCAHAPPPTTAAKPAAAAAAAPDALVWPLTLDHFSTPATHREAVMELLTESGVESAMIAMKDVILRQQIESYPVLQPYAKVLSDFLDKYVSFDALRDDFAQLYMERFNELQLRQMVAFYRTPTGKLAVRELPQVVQLGAQLGKRKVEEHMTELKQMIQQQQQKQGTPAP